MQPVQKLPARFVAEHSFHRALTFKERLLILIGYNLRMKTAVAVDRKRGDVGAKCEVTLTKNIDPSDEARDEAADCHAG